MKLNKDVDNLEAYYKRALKRFKACCSSLSHLYEPLREEALVKIRALEIIKFLKRLFLFDFKRLVFISTYSKCPLHFSIMFL
jgi:hypothetical protein